MSDKKMLKKCRENFEGIGKRMENMVNNYLDSMQPINTWQERFDDKFWCLFQEYKEPPQRVSVHEDVKEWVKQEIASVIMLTEDRVKRDLIGKEIYCDSCGGFRQFKICEKKSCV